jgi:hypothetical protein
MDMKNETFAQALRRLLKAHAAGLITESDLHYAVSTEVERHVDHDTPTDVWPGYTVAADGSRQYGALAKWVIWCPAEDVYWSLSAGWTGIEDATRFSARDKDAGITLPEGGEWHQEEEG